MSLCPVDWKRFDVWSGQLKIADASGGNLIVNAENGTWVTMCEYNDEHKVTMLAAMPERVAHKMTGGRVELDGVEESETIDAKSGIVFMVDRKLDGKMPSWFKVPDDRLNEQIVERFGKPDDDEKPQAEKFLECCFHMGHDYKTGMPTLENVGFGAVCELMRGQLNVNMLYNRNRDVVGIEVTRKD